MMEQGGGGWLLLSGRAPRLLFLLLIGSVGAAHEHEHEQYGKPLWNATYTDLLKRDLLATYDKFARPAQHTNVTKVTVDLDIRHVDLDVAKSLFSVNAWVSMTWTDEKLQWNESDYGGLGVLHLADHEVWEPDIVLYNSALGNNIDHYGNTHLLAYPNGVVLWVPPSHFAVYCELDLSKWPFDRHTCILRLGSWTYHGEQVDMQVKEEKSSGDREDAKVEWTIVNVTKRRNVRYYDCCPEPYIDVQFNVTIRRRSEAYTAILSVPIICALFLSLTSLWLPAHSKERYILIGLTSILAAIFLIYFTIRLPVSGPHTPLVVLFYAYTLLMTTLSVLHTVVLNSLSGSQLRLPRCLTGLLRGGPLSSLLLLPHTKTKLNYNQHGYEEEVGGGSEELREYDTEGEERRILERRSAAGCLLQQQEMWTVLTVALDRILFILYLFVYLSFLLRILL